MNKKIKVIELWNIISQVEDIEKLPKKIKYFEDIYELQTGSRDYYCYNQDDYLTDRVDDKPFNSFLNDFVEILEDNTEEIEELDRNLKFDELTTPYGKNEDLMWTEIIKQHNKINELVKAVNEIRKDMNKEQCCCCGVEITDENRALHNMCKECKYGIDWEGKNK